MNLLISPHNDDETLFAAYTLIREKPLVVVCTDSFIQPNRGDHGCTSAIRRAESIAAAKVIGHTVVFGGLRDDSLVEDDIRELLSSFHGFNRVYAPVIQGGNWQHDMIGKVAQEVFQSLIQYTTYSKTELWTRGTVEIVPTPEEREKKMQALACYQSQIQLPATRPHFEAVIDKSEWLIEK